MRLNRPPVRQRGKNTAPAVSPTGPNAWGPPSPRRVYAASAVFFELTLPRCSQSDDSIASFHASDIRPPQHTYRTHRTYRTYRTHCTYRTLVLGST